MIDQKLIWKIIALCRNSSEFTFLDCPLQRAWILFIQISQVINAFCSPRSLCSSGVGVTWSPWPPDKLPEGVYQSTNQPALSAERKPQHHCSVRKVSRAIPASTVSPAVSTGGSRAEGDRAQWSPQAQEDSAPPWWWDGNAWAGRVARKEIEGAREWM